MAFPSSRHAGFAGPQGTATPQDVADDEVMAPVIAGAYARGVAETLDMLGLPGVFLDGAGEVLFASRAAGTLLGGALHLRMRHLVAEHAADNQALAALIADAVGQDRTGAVARLPRAGIALRVLPRTAAMALPGQLVRAVVLLVDEGNPRQATLVAALAEPGASR